MSSRARIAEAAPRLLLMIALALVVGAVDPGALEAQADSGAETSPVSESASESETAPETETASETETETEPASQTETETDSETAPESESASETESETPSGMSPLSVSPPAPERAPASILPRLEWNPRWGGSGIPNYLMIGTSIAIAGLNMGIGPRFDDPTRGGVLWDERARNVMRLDTPLGRQIARDVSDVFITILTSYGSVVDGLLVAGFLHDSPDVAVQLVLMNAEVITFVLALQTTANVVMSRERPYGRTCGGGGPDDLPEDSGLCDSPARYYSFFSGHASQSFAGAAATCMHHLQLPLYGGSTTEKVVTCATGFVMAGAVAALRVMGDVHYTTDVIVGASVGTAIGFLLPYLLHYGHDEAPLTYEFDDAGTTVSVLPTPNGLSIFGAF